MQFICTDGIPNAFVKQLSWERCYMEIASKQGCIIFWLPCEDRESTRSIIDGPYAMDTRGELGEWRGRMMCNKHNLIKVVVGADPEFPGLSQIQRNFNEAFNTVFPIYSSLGETVEAAVTIADRRW